MRAAEGSDYPGYDGRVEASRATPLVPGGLSVWELGVGGDPGGKANDDYGKRTDDPLGVDQSQATFVFATPRRWRGRDAWAEAKRAEGTWCDVKAFDADNLETAFESAPAAHFWFSEIVGKPTGGVQTIEDWWERFSSISQPHLSPELVLAGRVDDAAALLRILEQETRITTISAASTDDVLAFVAASLLSAPEPSRGDLLAKTLIVREALSLRFLDSSADLLVLLPFEDDLRREAQLVRSHHVIFLAGSDVPADIELSRLDRDEFATRLRDFGVADEVAQMLARAAYRSIVAFQQEASPRRAMPRTWASLFVSKVVRRAWLAGSWNEARSGDLDVLAFLFGASYEDTRAELALVATGADPVFATVGAAWALTSPIEAWQFGNPHLDSLDLTALETVIQTVLGAVDPALELPIDERWAADLHGKTRLHSADLRTGLATTLALCGALGENQRVGLSGTAAAWASSVVAQLLRRANEDGSGQLWASLSDVLPLLSEAAPDAFLRAVQAGVTERSYP